mmetsp:Transcript_39588/g.95196  ORF Transcript_39588/g.95196 Transcript_39588/m.95196 type:complete len:203 (-) Transcript_39588:521-1129(-)
MMTRSLQLSDLSTRHLNALHDSSTRRAQLGCSSMHPSMGVMPPSASSAYSRFDSAMFRMNREPPLTMPVEEGLERMVSMTVEIPPPSAMVFVHFFKELRFESTFIAFSRTPTSEGWTSIRYMTASTAPAEMAMFLCTSPFVIAWRAPHDARCSDADNGIVCIALTIECMPSPEHILTEASGLLDPMFMRNSQALHCISSQSL